MRFNDNEAAVKGEAGIRQLEANLVLRWMVMASADELIKDEAGRERGGGGAGRGNIEGEEEESMGRRGV